MNSYLLKIITKKTNLPDDSRCLHVRSFLMRPRRNCENPAQNHSSERSAVRSLDVRDQLPDIAVQSHVLVAFELLLCVDETGDD